MRLELVVVRRVLMGLSILLGVLILLLWGYHFSTSHRSQQQAAALPDYGSVPSVTLTERSGRVFSLTELRGQVWVIDFVYTTCPGPCPLMTSRMRRLQEDLKNKPDVRLVSVTVDPETDTPAVLEKYAAAYQADPARWLFLTGSRPTIRKLATDELHLAMEKNPAPASVPDEGLIVHSTRFVLMDRQGHNRGYYDSTDNDSMQQLLHDIDRLLAEKSA